MASLGFGVALGMVGQVVTGILVGVFFVGALEGVSLKTENLVDGPILGWPNFFGGPALGPRQRARQEGWGPWRGAPVQTWARRACPEAILRPITQCEAPPKALLRRFFGTFF